MLMKKLSDSEYWELLDAVSNINKYADILQDYCAHNSDNSKVNNIGFIVELTKQENAKIMDKF